MSPRYRSRANCCREPVRRPVLLSQGHRGEGRGETVLPGAPRAEDWGYAAVLRAGPRNRNRNAGKAGRESSAGPSTEEGPGRRAEEAGPVDSQFQELTDPPLRRHRGRPWKPLPQSPGRQNPARDREPTPVSSAWRVASWRRHTYSFWRLGRGHARGYRAKEERTLGAELLRSTQKDLHW
jgi:hypothetical protein